MYKIPKSYKGKSGTFIWEYRSLNNELNFITARYDAPHKKKDVVPYILENGDWINKAPAAPRPLFGLHLLGNLSNQYVAVTEGEKCASSLQCIGLVGITSLGGCNAAALSDWSPLSGTEDVLILIDNDDSGKRYCRDVYNALMNLKNPPTRIYSVLLPKLPEGGDAVDWIQARLPEWEGYAPLPEKDREWLREELLATIDSCKVLMTSELLASQKEWDSVINFDNINTPDIPASLLPEPYAAFAKALANSVEVPEGMVVMAVLGVVSTVLTKRFVISPMEGWSEAINTYTMITMPPGNNKSLVLKRVSEPLVIWEREQAKLLLPQIANQESIRKTEQQIIAVKRKKASDAKNQDICNQLMQEVAQLETTLTEVQLLPNLFASDATPESLANSVNEQDGRFAVLTDEGGIIETLSGLYSAGLANVDIILKGIDGGSLRVRRKDRNYDLNPYLTMLLIVQPQILLNMKGKKALTGNGVLERFLYVIPKSNLGYRTNSEPPVSKELMDSYKMAVAKLLAIEPLIEDDKEEPRRLLLTSEAYKEFQDFRHHIEPQFRDNGKLHYCANWGAKIPGYYIQPYGYCDTTHNSDSIYKPFC